MPALKFLIALPMPLPSCGRRLAPKMMTTIARMTSSSGIPIRPIAVLLVLLIVPPWQRALPGQFAAGVNLVEVYATVSDSRGEPVTGLSAADFVVRADGVQQNVTTFAADGVPLSHADRRDRVLGRTV